MPFVGEIVTGGSRGGGKEKRRKKTQKRPLVCLCIDTGPPIVNSV